jgi:hypothetical protein
MIEAESQNRRTTMASATADIETVVTLKGVTLSLTPVEARVLLYVLNSVGGCPECSPRKHVDKITAVLAGAGVVAPAVGDPEITEHTIYFKDGCLDRFE